MIVQCDFDGTIAVNNLSLLIREAYAREGWRNIEREYAAGRLTVEQSSKLQFPLVSAAEGELRAFVRRHAEVRSGFLDFVAWCREEGVRFVIVSSGLDFYIDEVLKANEAPDIELYSARTRFKSGGIEVEYTDPAGNRIERGFKSSHARWLREQGAPLAYAGDGGSDFEAALIADEVFATGRLRQLLRSGNIPHHTLGGFADIRERLSRRE